MTYAHLFDQVKQDWFAVVSILEHTLKTLKNQLPVIKSAYLRSDNAGCYHCGNTWLSLDGISKRTGNIYVINKLSLRQLSHTMKTIRICFEFEYQYFITLNP